MNIQAENLISLLSGSQGPDNMPQTLADLNGAQADFAATFVEQLQALRNVSLDDANGANVVATDINASIREWVNAAKSGDALSDLKGFVDLLGKDLPLAKKVDTDIDLEDTLQTLAGVLQQLQQLETDTPSPSVLLPAESIENQQPALSESGQGPADAVVAAESAMVMPLNTQLSNTSVTETVITDETGFGDAERAVPLAEVNKKALPLAKRELQSQPTMLSGNDLGEDFNRSISALLANEGNKFKPAGKADLDVRADNLLKQIETQTESSAKALPNVAADIAKLSQALPADKQTVPVQQSMLKPFADSAWPKELGEKVIWMYKQSVPAAELRLNPEHLGPVLVKIDVNHDQASVAFTAQHLAVKEALEAAIPKLREMLGGQQLNLVDVNVSQQQSEQRQQARDFSQLGHGQSRAEDLEANGAVSETQNLVDEIEAGRAIASNGLLSIFA